MNKGQQVTAVSRHFLRSNAHMLYLDLAKKRTQGRKTLVVSGGQPNGTTKKMKIAITFLMTFLFFFCSGQEKRKACLTSADTLKGQKIYTQNDLLDSLPRFGNNISDFHNYLRKNFGSTYKKDADNSIYKIVYSFIIDTDGKLIHPCILNNLDNPNYDRLQADFAMAVEKCPKWRCGYKDTAKVVTRMTYEMDIKHGY